MWGGSGLGWVPPHISYWFAVLVGGGGTLIFGVLWLHIGWVWLHAHWRLQWPVVKLVSAAAIAPPAPQSQPPSPTYLRGIDIGYSGRPADPVIVVGQHAGMTQKLRLYLDHAIAGPGGSPPVSPHRVHLGDLLEGITSQSFHLPIIRTVEGGAMVWGDGKTQFASRAPISGTTMWYCRLVVMDDDNRGQEQHHYFRIVAPGTSEARPFIFLCAEDRPWTYVWENK